MEVGCSPDRSAGVKCSAGFTLLEILMVVAIISIIAGISVPPIRTAIVHSRLRGASGSLAGLIQSGRMLAVKRNQTMTLRFLTRANVPFAFVKNVQDRSPDASTSDPQVQLGSSTFRVTVPTGDTAPLSAEILSYTPLNFPELISFNPRGLPCKQASGACTTAGFIYYLTDTSQRNAWTAVSISPGGRVKQWFWNGRGWTD